MYPLILKFHFSVLKIFFRLTYYQPFTSFLISFLLLYSNPFHLFRTLQHQSYRTALQELERALGELHAKNLEESLRILLEEHSTEIKMIRSEAQRSIDLTASETHTRLEEVHHVCTCFIYLNPIYNTPFNLPFFLPVFSILGLWLHSISFCKHSFTPLFFSFKFYVIVIVMCILLSSFYLLDN